MTSGAKTDALQKPLNECICLFDLVRPEEYLGEDGKEDDWDEFTQTRGEQIRLLGKTLDGKDVLVRLCNFRPWLYLDLEARRNDPELATYLVAVLRALDYKIRQKHSLPDDGSLEKCLSKRDREEELRRRAEEDLQLIGSKLDLALRTPVGEATAENVAKVPLDEESFFGADGLIGLLLERRKQVIGWEPEPGQIFDATSNPIRTRQRLYARLTFRSREQLKTADGFFSRALFLRDPLQPWKPLEDSGAAPPRAYEGGRSVATETKFFTKTDQAPFAWFWLKRKRDVPHKYRDSWCDLEYVADLEDVIAQPQHKGNYPPLRMGAWDTEWMSYNGDFPQIHNWGDHLICIGMVWADVLPGQPFKVRYECDAYADPADPRYAFPGDSAPNPVPPAARSDGSPAALALMAKAEQAARDLRTAKQQQLSQKPPPPPQRLGKEQISLEDTPPEETSRGETSRGDTPLEEWRAKLLWARSEATVRRHAYELDCFQSWFERLRTLRFDVLFTFNGDKFDDAYVFNRIAVLTALPPEKIPWLRCSRLKNFTCRLREKVFNTKGKGYNVYYRVPIPGALKYDMLLWAKDNYKQLTRHNLDTVLEAMGLRLKNDVSPQQIFAWTRAGHKQWLDILDYCGKDSKRVTQMVHKGNFVPRWLALASVTKTPWSILSSGGQQIRIWNLLLHEAHKRGYVVNQTEIPRPKGTFKWTDDDRLKCKLVVQRQPRESLRTWFPGIQIEWKNTWPGRKEISTKFRIQSEDKIRVIELLEQKGYVQIYTGATVIKPNPGHHKSPIVTLDYASLYPSIMIAYNLCYSTVINDATLAQRPDLLPSIQLFEIVKGKPHMFMHHRVERGLLPYLLEGLLGARKAVKKLLELETNESRKVVLDSEQNELKVTANSTYGFTGATLSGKCPEPRIAETVTFCGREGLETTKKLVEGMDLPPLLTSERWADFIKQERWLSAVTWYANAPPAPIDPEGFKRIHRREMNKYEKNTLARLRTALDAVPSELWYQAEEGHLNAGTRFMNETPALFWVLERYGPLTDQPIALLLPGVRTEVIYGDSVTADCPVLWRNALTKYVRLSNIEDLPAHVANALEENLSSSAWSKYHGDKEAIAYANQVDVWTEKGWTRLRRIVRHKTDKKIVRVLTHTGCVQVTEDHSLLDENANKVTPNHVKVGDSLLHADLPTPDDDDERDDATEVSRADQKRSYQAMGLFHALLRDPSKQVPHVLLNAPRCLRQAFWEGFCVGAQDTFEFVQQIGSASLYWLAASLGYSVSIHTAPPEGDSTFSRASSDVLYRLTCTREKQRPNPNAIQKIEVLGQTQDYVYDLETENHHFSAGVGRMIVHNTDSVMVKFPLQNNCNGRRVAFLLGYHGAAEATKIMPAPMSLTMEKIYRPYVLLAKKKYIGLKWLFPDDLYPCKDVKGLDTVRRDCILLFKDLIQSWIDEILDTDDFGRAYTKFEEFVQAILEKRFAFESLKQSKSTKPQYANEHQVQLVICNQMEHDVPGSAPPAGARVEYVVGSTGKKDDPMFKRVLAWSRAERYLKEGRLPPGFKSVVDIGYYLEHNLRSVFVKLFGVWMPGGQAAATRIFNAFASEAALIVSGQTTLRSFFLHKADAPPAVVAVKQLESVFAAPPPPSVLATLHRSQNSKRPSTSSSAPPSAPPSAQSTAAANPLLKRRRKNPPAVPLNQRTLSSFFQ